MKICEQIFDNIEIRENGEAFFCCEHGIHEIYLGNVHDESFDKIWNSEIAVDIRKNALEGKYPYCTHNICPKITNPEEYFPPKKDDYKSIMQRGPIFVAFYLGEACNAKCIFCRDNIKIETKEKTEEYKKIFYSAYYPILKDVKTIQISNTCEIFYSDFFKEIIKKITEEFPQIKFRIITNGTLLTEENIKQLNLENKISELYVSINAATAKTHQKISRINAWKNLTKNLDYIKNIPSIQNNLHFTFVVCKHNYKEMKNFVKFAEKYNAKISFWEIRNHQNNSLENDYYELAVHLKEHKENNKLKKHLASKIFNQENVLLSPALKQLRDDELNKKTNSFFYKLFK